MSSPAHKEKIWNLIKDIRVGMLCTICGDEIHARPMTLVQDSYDGTIWFFTDLSAEKRFEIEKDAHVCITFSNPTEEVYVSLSGSARLERNPEMVEALWNSYIGAWFPQGKDDPNVGFVRIKVHAGEHWDADTSRFVQLFHVAKAKAMGTVPDMGEHQKFGDLHH